MSFSVRSGSFDIIVAAGPRVKSWPTAGARALSTFCAEMGLSVGLIGGEGLFARGAIPLPGTGAILIAEDMQKRIHRYHTRALVRVSRSAPFPDPFPGWQCEGLIPIDTADRLLQDEEFQWTPGVAILGTGNRALKFGSRLFERGMQNIICVESSPGNWGAKRFAGWEVARRRFEMQGGKVLEAKPISLKPKSPLVWELRLEDAQGVRVLDVARVVSAGPFSPEQDHREYPPGSLLFELEQTSEDTPADDPEGWAFEEERGRFLAGKLAKALLPDLGEKRERLDDVYRKAKSRLRRYRRHREVPFTPSYEGKWFAPADAKLLRKFPGVPTQAHHQKLIASVECFEAISCMECQKACPTRAISFLRKGGQILSEKDCTSCGACVVACPSGAVVMIRDQEDRSFSQTVFPWRGKAKWQAGEFATLVNRKGEGLGTARVTAIPTGSSEAVQLVQLDIPTHLLWEARDIRRPKADAASDPKYLLQMSEAHTENRVEVFLDGEKRLVRDKIPLSIALFETGRSGPRDVLFCQDGSCGLCQLEVDGVKRHACKTEVHRGMSIRLNHSQKPLAPDVLCPCLDITKSHVLDRIRQGKLRSPEAVLSVTHVGEGRCHGQMCMESLRRLLAEEGMESSTWIDWRFPWSDWYLIAGSHEKLRPI